MSDFVTIKVSKENLKQAFAERVDFWSEHFSPEFLTAVSAMYSADIDAGCWDGREVDIKSIVDNDVINNLVCDVKNNKMIIIDARTGQNVYEMEV